MKRTPRVGDSGTEKFVVGEPHLIDIAGDRELAVLSTPSLIWFLEHAARHALREVLEPGETSVGVAVEVEHLAATPSGHRVQCTARVIHIEGTLITFQVTAVDERERIARGVHRRRVVLSDRFREQVRRKME